MEELGEQLYNMVIEEEVMTEEAELEVNPDLSDEDKDD